MVLAGPDRSFTAGAVDGGATVRLDIAPCPIRWRRWNLATLGFVYIGMQAPEDETIVLGRRVSRSEGDHAPGPHIPEMSILPRLDHKKKKSAHCRA